MAQARSDQPDSSSGEKTPVDLERTAEIERKHRMVSGFLESNGYDALLLRQAANFSWFTTGGDCSVPDSSEGTAALFITPDSRVVVASNADANRIFNQEVSQLGFLVKEHVWQEPAERFLKDLCRGRTVVSDTGFGSSRDVSDELGPMRRVLSPFECQRLRQLGRIVAHAVEATARGCTQGRTEAEIAGEVAHRLMKHQVTPLKIQVVADGKTDRYRNWNSSDVSVEHMCVISASGRKDGLCLGASRTVCFDAVPEDLAGAHQRAALVQAAGMHFSRNGWTIGAVWNRVRRIYEKFGCANAWRAAPSGEVTGYQHCERSVIPESAFTLESGMALHWHPSVGAAMLGDSVLIGPDGPELLTPTENWPRLTIEVKGAPVYCPEILVKSPAGSVASGGDDTVANDSVLEYSLDDSFGV